MENLKFTTNIRVYTLDECDDERKKLIVAAKEITKQAYAPYSNFHVGAAALLENGEIVVGNNQENAAYPSGLCAERVTLFHANALYPDQKVKVIAIAACNHAGFTKEPCSPCGACRQVILEIENKHEIPLKVIMYGDEKIYEFDSIKDILPFSFGKTALD